MEFDYYESFYSTKAGRWCPGVKARRLDLAVFMELAASDRVRSLVAAYRDGSDAEAKAKLPAVAWVGRTTTGMRKAADMEPTQYYMVDVDHVAGDVHKAATEIMERMGAENVAGDCLVAHVTPSGHGLRFVMRAVQQFATVAEHMEWLDGKLKFGDFGDFDTAVKDLSRLSFMVDADSVLYIDGNMFAEAQPQGSIARMEAAAPAAKKRAAAKRAKAAEPTEDTAPDAAEPTEAEDYSQYRYRGHLVADIIKRYVEIFGEPGNGERHNFYNQMVKYFRCITDNNPQVLCALLPAFDTEAGEDERMSQCRSICRTNTTGRLPREFFMFLVKNGFYKEADAELDAAVVADAVVKKHDDYTASMPPLPPVFREIVASCPKDFIIPCINALLPVLGTLTSRVRAVYPFDARDHSTEFFSVIYAPPGTGKGFIERFISMLHRNLELRDTLSDRREAIYCSLQTRKGDNERAPENPRVTKRIMEAKNSETDFLEKQAANNGHHMFTYAAEMDQWRKGVRAAGGNKDDMIRIAWDNGYYGQSFKSPNSFKGRVKLYWNVLITGTQDQLDAYFKNVSNGLVTRCSFSAIENQEFADAPKWKTIPKRDMEVINKFVDRCDTEEYKNSVDFDVTRLDEINDDDFDKEVPWRFEFNPLKTVDLAWVMPTINKWLKKEQKKALLSQDMARDVFRRRVAVRGFRLALICSQLWSVLKASEKNTVCRFVAWWMDVDIEQIINLYGEKYNDAAAACQTDVTSQPKLWDLLPDEFTLGDMKVAAAKAGVKTTVRVIVHRWKRSGLLEDGKEKNTFSKTKNNRKK